MTPNTATLEEISETLSLTSQEFKSMMKIFANSDNYLKINIVDDGSLWLCGFEGNSILVEYLVSEGVLTKGCDVGLVEEEKKEIVNTSITPTETTGYQEKETKPTGEVSQKPSECGTDYGDDNEEPVMDIDQIIGDLCDMFKEKNDREPTEEEVKSWLETIQGGV